MLPLLIAAAALGQTSDPRLAPAFRENRAGWIYAHLEGKPSSIGYQYGYLLAPEIDDAEKALKVMLQKPWQWYRSSARALFWTKLDPEYREELQGMADGLKAKGFAYDVTDMLAFNSYIELNDYYLPSLSSPPGSNTRESCSAFVATGGVTKDGKIVMGHNLWWDYVMGQRCNAILDIKPAKGNRILMDAFCGFIHSGSDFAINSAGVMVCETTISGFHGFDKAGLPEFMRMRKAIQYSNSLDDFVRIMRTGNNGGYANTWLLGDIKTNQIGKLELGLKNVNFSETHDGAYVGANFPEDPKLIAEEVEGFSADPLVNGCMRRKHRWETLLKENEGQVDADKAKVFLADTFDEVGNHHGADGNTLCGKSLLSGAINAKVVTADMAKKMTFWAKMGIPDGSEVLAADVFKAGPDLSRFKPYLRDIKAQPWVLFPAPGE